VFPLALGADDSATPRLFVIYSINDDGSLTCSANTPAGSTIFIGSPGSGEVVNSAKTIAAAVKKTKGEAVLLFSCFSRSVILTNLRDEMDAIQEEFRDSKLPYMFVYAGGEICPVYNKKGNTANRYHNYSIVSCVLATSDRNTRI
jgi:hypothetical protein